VSDERHARVKALFLGARGRPPEARRAFLEQVCGDDEGLMREVESLLRHHDGSTPHDSASPRWLGDFLDVDATGSRPLPETNPRSIGNYVVRQKLGEGGMGEVYEAEQVVPVRRRVALKLIKWGMDTKEVVARFESERQALALMNHPSIASVFDAGATMEGRPYFVMEYVPGEPITDYCNKHRLTVRERLGLFLEVCDGVQHAHQKGVIHRDIKPSNVLVALLDDRPVPKIIDFGVAKATSRHLTEKTLYTELGQWIGTPEYMSPEQAEMTGLDIDTRTDVYSMGVMLYELLAGAQPFDPTQLRRAGFDGIRRILREEEPPKPSTRVRSLGHTSMSSARNRRVELLALEKELRGDLDWITMKALEKDRTRRYGSAADLAADIRRHLTNQPVLAGPPGTAYRMGKFVRRHRLAVAAVTSVLLALIVGVVGTTVGLTRAVRSERVASEEAARARSEASKTRAINTFLQEILESASPSAGLGPEVTVVEALDAAAASIGESFRDQPEIEASVRSAIGRTYTALGRYDAAESHLESALEIRRRVLAANHPDLVESLDLLADAVLARGDVELAEKLAREAVSVARSLHGADRVHLCNSLDVLAWLMVGKGDHETAKALYEEALSAARDFPGEASEEFVIILHNSGVAAEYRGDFAAAGSIYRDTLERIPQGSFNHAAGIHNLAWVAYEQGDYAAAETGFRDCLSAWATMYEDSHPTMVRTRAELAMTLVARGRLEEAEGIYRRALESKPDLLTVLNQRRVQVASAYGALLAGMGSRAKAERQLVGALEFLQEHFGVTDPRTRQTLHHLVDLYAAWGRPERAAEYRALLNSTAETRQ